MRPDLDAATRWHGVHTALITPMLPDGALDLEAWGALCERQLDAGVHGLVPCGTTGETPTLSPAEQDLIVREAVVRAHARPQRALVIAGAGSNDTRQTVVNIERVAQLGVDAALVVFPYYNKPTPAGLRAHVRELTRPGLPVVLYHVPGRTGQRLSVELLAELCEQDGVVAVKEATGDLTYDQELLGRTTCPVLSGDDFTFAPLTVMGGAGVISVLSNLAPALTVRWYTAATTGDVPTLRSLRSQLQPVVHALFAESNPIPAKAAMAAMGLCGDTLRLPLVASRWPLPAALQELA
jgi:4-hydroxy-tetrahydrodipicolinate synthase